MTALKPLSPFALTENQLEHDACGVGFITTLSGKPSHDIVHRGLLALERLEHRGAVGAEENSGDGAGILIQVPDKLFQRECALGRIVAPEPGRVVTELPARGEYAAGLFFGSPDAQATTLAKLILAMIVRQEGQKMIGFRRVPTDERELGQTAKGVQPVMEHVFIGKGDGIADGDAFERKLFVIRKRFQAMIRLSGIDDRNYFYIASLSSRTLVYKGMLTPLQVRSYFADLEDTRTESALCLFHSRFSTNTFPSWELAHPYRMIAHNGEINTLRGNLSWMRAREALLSSKLLGEDIEKILPIVHEGLSDSACLDSVLELLVMGGRSLPHALMMLMPEAYEHDAAMSPEKKAFYEFHSCVAEPWDGPACVCFTDGRYVGATLDRNGLRPARYWVTRDGLVCLASEVGVLDVADEDVIEKGRLSPGRMFLVDLDEKRIVSDTEIKTRIATEHPYGEWLAQHLMPIERLPEGPVVPALSDDARARMQLAFGYTEEDLRILLAPMAERGEEAIGSMGNDASLAVLSDKPRSLFDYFHQLFAQVTNPPLDAVREKIVTSVSTAIGPEGNLLEPVPESCRQVLVQTPFLRAHEMARFRALSHFDKRRERASAPPPSFDDAARPFGVAVLDMVFAVKEGEEGLEPALRALFAKADIAIAQGVTVLILSDRTVGPKLAPIPSLLAVAGLHNHLVREKKRSLVTILVETGEAREVHHFAALIGYGASAIHPYLALESLPGLRKLGLVDASKSDEALEKAYLKAVEKGVVKVMSKMGISTIASYRGAQIFEAVGVAKALIDRYFTHTPSRIGGVGAFDIAHDVLRCHMSAYADARRLPVLENQGQYQWRRDGETHLFNPETVFKLQHATREKRYVIFKEYTRAIDESHAAKSTLRGLLQVRTEGRTPISIQDVEPAEAIMKRFATGAMSYGSISAEAHETLAIAMNRIGGRSNSGEGGEDPKRYAPDANGDSRRSAIKQVASARFGVTSAYLVNADEIQIKMAQGAKPGEGGQLPGNKVYPWIAKVRFATEGVGLISPPPHHDIYSIEDLAQLIFDLRQANPRARISVKLVSEVGVGTVAAGVAKAKSDVILVSGHDGGTGASPLTSLKHAGVPWELGLAETQQALVKNGLRERVVVQVDGQMKTGRDVVIAALLGAEEFGFATAPLVVMGCVMMRVCHLDTCPVGIATQNPALRKTFTGKAEHVIRFFRFIAEEVRDTMAKLGFYTLDEMIGRTDLLEARIAPEGKRGLVDMQAVLAMASLAQNADENGTPLKSVRSERETMRVLDHELIDACEAALFDGKSVSVSRAVRNTDRAAGTLLGSELTRRYGEAGLPDATIDLSLTGSAGQSLGAFLPRGIRVRLEGDANDFVGKGLSGGVIAVTPPRVSTFDASTNVVAGNVALYGATSGRAFFGGAVGERFAVRNSGAHAVVEMVGDHGCEYMTGGRVVVLGAIGRNFAAGMSGGIAYVKRDLNGLSERINAEMVKLEDLDGQDVTLIESLLREHFAMTGSVAAQAWLEHRDPAVFVRVMPVDYKRALERAHKANASLDIAAAE